MITMILIVYIHLIIITITARLALGNTEPVKWMRRR